MELPEASPKLQESCNETIAKYGIQKCKEAHRLAMAIFESNLKNGQPAKGIPWGEIADQLGVDNMAAMDLWLAGSTLDQQEMKPKFEETMRHYNASKHKLPTCPKDGCSGKLHQTVAIAEELNGLYHCDSCDSIFRKKS